MLLQTILRAARPCALLAGLFFMSAPNSCFAQASGSTSGVAPTYDFLTVTTTESAGSKSDCKMLIAPPFSGKSEVQLETAYGIDGKKDRERLQLNAVAITQQLTAITAAGWELFQVYPLNLTSSLVATRYLFRKAQR